MLLVGRLIPEIDEFPNAFLGVGMMKTILVDCQPSSDDIGPCHSCIDDLSGVANCGDDNLSIKLVVIADGENAIDEAMYFLTICFLPANEGRNVERPGTHGLQGLHSRENQRAVDANVLLRESFDNFEGGFDALELYHKIRR